MSAEDNVLAALLLLAAILYSSIGHAGASGYLAAMALVDISPAVMKPTALGLNILVAVIATTKFYRMGFFSWRLFIPLAITAIPLAYIGGGLNLPSAIYKPIVGIILIYAAWRSFNTAKNASEYEVKTAPLSLLLFVGGVLGFLSGLTGVGGGIFLSPLLLFCRWAPVKIISGVAAAFILVNSIAGILGVVSASTQFHPALPIWAIIVVIGGYVGAECGSKHLSSPVLQQLLALVLLVAGVKMIATA